MREREWLAEFGDACRWAQRFEHEIARHTRRARSRGLYPATSSSRRFQARLLDAFDRSVFRTAIKASEFLLHDYFSARRYADETAPSFCVELRDFSTVLVYGVRLLAFVRQTSPPFSASRPEIAKRLTAEHVGHRRVEATTIKRAAAAVEKTCRTFEAQRVPGSRR
jgi:hypothetical protein